MVVLGVCFYLHARFLQLVIFLVMVIYFDFLLVSNEVYIIESFEAAHYVEYFLIM